MGVFCRLVHGAKEFILEDAYHSLGPDFVPPAVNEQSIFSGSQGNEGAYEIDSQALDRDWTFSIRIRGDSKAEIEMEFRRLADFLRLSKDKSETLYFEYGSNTNYTAKLMWGGWGGPLRFVVKRGSVTLSPQYNIATAAGWKMIGENPIMLTIGPLAETKEFKAGNALGGILEDYWFTKDRTSRGLIIPEATTNKMTDPVCNAAWTAAAGVIDIENTDPQYCLPGRFTSRHIIYLEAGAHQYYKSINVGNTNKHSFSAYFKRPDGGAVTSADVEIYYGANIGSNYQNLGNGVWLVYADNIDGINAATNTGFRVIIGRDIYLLGYQVEEKAYHTPLCYGDLLGCAWSSTAHASTSTRTAAKYGIDGAGAYNPAQGTIVIAWKSPSAMSGFGFYLFKATGGVLSLYCGGANWTLSDGTNSAVSSGLTTTANTIYIFHCKWGPAGLELYRNGVSVATNATFLPAAIVSLIYLGSDQAPALHSNGTFLGFSIFDGPMTGTEVAADYANIIQHVAGGDGLGQRLGGIPWHWTVAGGGLYDSHTDSGHQNWGVVGGIPGSSSAKIVLKITTANAVYVTNGLYISNCIINHFFNPVSNLFFDLSGTADAAACGGAVLRTAVSSTVVEIGTGAPSRLALIELYDKVLNLMTRLKIASTNNVSIYWKFDSCGYNIAQSKISLISATTYWFGQILQALFFPGKNTFMQDYTSGFYLSWFKLLAYLTGGPKNLDVDYIDVLPEPTLYFDGDIYDGDAMIYQHPYTQRTTTNLVYGNINVRGHEINLTPNKFNLLQVLAKVGSDYSMVSTVTFNWINIKPRYMLL